MSKRDTPTENKESFETVISLWLLIHEQEASAKAWISEWSIIGTLTIILIILISWIFGFTFAFTPVTGIIVIVGLTARLVKHEQKRLSAAKDALVGKRRN